MCATGGVAREQALIILYVFPNTNKDGDKPKAHKKHAQKMLDKGHLNKGKTHVQIWGLKRREGICSMGAYFQEITVHT